MSQSKPFVLLIVGAPSAVVWCFRAAFRAVAVSASACAVLVASASASAVLVAAATASAVLVDRAVGSAVRTVPRVTILGLSSQPIFFAVLQKKSNRLKARCLQSFLVEKTSVLGCANNFVSL